MVKYMLDKNTKKGDFQLVNDILPRTSIMSSGSVYRMMRCRRLFDPHSPSEVEARYPYHANIRRESRMKRSQLGRHKYNVRIYQLRYKEWICRETGMFALLPIFLIQGESVPGYRSISNGVLPPFTAPFGRIVCRWCSRENIKCW